ncbi:GNAT family N-acetyltransferase [Xylophilus sp.]|uniref:GNAT family N-acetyltransferase n=1 Tax=Xylophilus sp. TaxID=2653893 RepID=UPI003FCD4FA8
MGPGPGHEPAAPARQWAAQAGIRRLELTVVASNRRAIALYERAGFAREGVRRQSLFIDGGYVNELHMALLL